MHSAALRRLCTAWLFLVAANDFQSVPAADADHGDRVLLDFEGDFDPAAVKVQDARVSLVAAGDGHALRLATGHGSRWPGVTLQAPAGGWDLSAFGHVALDVTNLEDHPVEIGCRLDSPGPGGQAYRWQQQFTLAPGAKATLAVALKRRMPPAVASKLFGMRGYPGGMFERRGVDTARVQQILVFAVQPTADHVLQIDNVRARGTGDALRWIASEPDRLFPLIDRFGQYVHKDWPGKIHAEDDLARRRTEEAADLEKHPGPTDWDPYGGWTAGPQREATGFFRTAKVRGRWWLIDPAGRLFWSHGADCVGPGGSTPITDREPWFAELPAGGSPFAQFYGQGAWAAHGYYHDKRYRTYNFKAANLRRKYGPSWKQPYDDLCHRRLRSWGMNTIGNWSDAGLYLERKTPYVVAVHAAYQSLKGSRGYWGKFPDVFDPGFRASLASRMAAERGHSAGDPWCIGYFVGNELSWGDDLSLAVATLASPPEQAAKRVFVADLKAKYGPIEKLNGAWGRRYASWDALLESRDVPDTKKAVDDLAAFETKTARQFFRTCRETVKQVAPDNLYLGCRFAWTNDRAVRAAAEYCDVISFNRYRDTVADFTLPEGVDKPAIIGEFHFGALDRGMFHPGLREVPDQSARAEAYRSYVEGALDNPYLVGTHWFQYGDQATTGRSDGENYQIGLVDIGDTPYVETIEAVRQVGAEMYVRRFGHRRD